MNMVTKEAPNGIDRAIENAVVKLEGGLRLYRANIHGPYEVDVFSEDRFLSNHGALTEVVIGFARRELGWTDATARTIYEKALRVESPEDESQIPSVLIYRREGQLAGVSAQRLKYIRKIPLHYHILRAFEEEYRGAGMGRDSIADTRLLHRKAKYYAARNGGPIPVWTTQQADKERMIFEPGTSHPWERLYDQDDDDREYQDLMGELHMDIRTNGKWINGSTGVSIGDYPEYNRSYPPDPNHVPTNDLLKRMEGKRIRHKELGMDIQRGDSVITIIKFKS